MPEVPSEIAFRDSSWRCGDPLSIWHRSDPAPSAGICSASVTKPSGHVIAIGIPASWRRSTISSERGNLRRARGVRSTIPAKTKLADRSTRRDTVAS
jgi:hypothetical protein